VEGVGEDAAEDGEDEGEIGGHWDLRVGARAWAGMRQLLLSGLAGVGSTDGGRIGDEAGSGINAGCGCPSAGGRRVGRR
jgi:hypothetical protein